jgi:ferritin-like metal-binding protein YciE
MSASTAQDLFEAELKDMYDAEQRLVKVLDKISPKITSPELKQGLEDHRQETVQQIERLENVFAAADLDPQRETCHGILGLAKELDHFVEEEDPEPLALDAYTTGAQLKVEHYEIVSYAMLIKLARQCGFDDDVIGPLSENLNEELQASQLLEDISGKALADLP